MESKQKYLYLEQRSFYIAVLVVGFSCFYAGIMIVSVYSYNPAAIAIANSFGMSVVGLGIVFYSKILGTSHELVQCSPFLFGILANNIQTTGILGFYYDPLNRGLITEILCLFGVLYSFKTNLKTSVYKISLLICAIGLGLSIYYSLKLWTFYGICYSLACLVWILI